MIRHIVMWRVSDIAFAREQVKQGFEGLRGRIPGLRRLEVGIDISAADDACDVVLVSDFESQAALDAYATHPEHLRVRRELGTLRTSRHLVEYVVQE